MGQLQHNKTIVVKGDNVNAAVCGSTNYSWRGFFVQANNAIVVQGKKAIQPFLEAFENYWKNEKNNVGEFSGSGSPEWTSLDLEGIDAKVSFSPHSSKNAKLDEIAKDIEKDTTSSLFFSLAFLYQTQGAMRNAIKVVTDKTKTVVYGISDRPVGGLDVQLPNGNQAVVAPAALTGKAVPEPFKSEPTGGGGVRMHHKFLVVDFNKPTARVYMGSYNFSSTADTKNGENLLVIKDRRVATAYMVEALQIFDHYHFRVAQQEAKKARKSLGLQKPPAAGEKAWWDKYYTDPVYVRDRQLFSQAVGKAVAAGG